MCDPCEVAWADLMRSVSQGGSVVRSGDERSEVPAPYIGWWKPHREGGEAPSPYFQSPFHLPPYVQADSDRWLNVRYTLPSPGDQFLMKISPNRQFFQQTTGIDCIVSDCFGEGNFRASN